MTKTLSAQAPEELCRRVDKLGDAEGRSRSQVVLAAVEFWTHLPPEAHLAIRQIQAMGEEVAARLYRHVASDALDVQFAAARERIVATMNVPAELAVTLGPAAEDDAFLDAASAAVRRTGVAR